MEIEANRESTLWSITMMENIFNQNKKLIAIYDRENIAQRGVKALRSTLYCGKCFSYVYKGDSILESTSMAMNSMVENESNRI